MLQYNKPLHLLLIEDNPGDVLLLEDQLTERFEKLSIHRAANFKQAIALINKPPHQFDVVLLDLTLPDKGGAELLLAITALVPHLPVIVLTGLINEEFSIRSLGLGATDYLVKEEVSSTSLFKSILYSMERKQIARQLEESEQRYKNLFAFTPQPIWVCDPESRAILDVNRAACQHYGYTREEFLTMSVNDLEPQAAVSILDRVSLEQLNSDNPFFGGIFTHQLHDKTLVVVELYCNSITYYNREAEIVVANDITDRVQYIAAVEKQNKQLQEISWIQSHVVRAPLTRMMGLINVLELMSQDEATKHKVLKHIMESAHEVDDIIRDIVKKSEKILPESKRKPA